MIHQVASYHTVILISLVQDGFISHGNIDSCMIHQVSKDAAKNVIGFRRGTKTKPGFQKAHDMP